MARGNDGCNILHTYYGMAQGKRVISLVTVKCNFVGKYIKPPPTPPPITTPPIPQPIPPIPSIITYVVNGTNDVYNNTNLIIN